MCNLKTTLIGCGLLLTSVFAATVSAQDSAAGEGAWRNYDFVPGSRVVKVISFDEAAVGRFPSEQVRFGRGALEVVEFEGRRWLESKAASMLRIDLPETLGREFSLEFTLRIPTNNIGARVYFRAQDRGRSAADEDYLDLTARAGIARGGREVSGTEIREVVKKFVPVKFQVTGEYAILYVGTDRVAMLPAAMFPRSSTIELQLGGNPRFPVYVGDFVVSVGLDDLGAALAAGRPYTTRGILFDIGSDRLRPESTRTLTTIVEALTKAASVRVVIEGHTDSTGEADDNLRLSSRRATAVVEYLVNHGIDRGRLVPVGKGESEPIVLNDSPEHRQTNRRVVIVDAGRN